MGHIRALVLLALAVLPAFAAGCAREPAPPLRLGTNVWPGYEPLYLARSLGYLDGTPVHLAEYTSAVDVIRSFRNGQLEAAALTLDETLVLSQEFPDLSVILVMDVSNGADAVLGRPPMSKVADLKGKRVGLENSALGAYMLERALDSSGLALKDITMVPLEVSDHEEAFKKRRVDAVVTFEPVRTRLIDSGARVLFDSSRIPDEIVDVLLVRSDYLAAHPGEVRALLSAYYRAVDYLGKNPEDAARRIAPRLHLGADEALASFSGMVVGDREKNRELLSGPRPRLLDTASKLARVMHRHNLLQREGFPEGMISAAALEKLK